MRTRKVPTIRQSVTKTVLLYRVVFGTRCVLLAVIALLFSILVQPVHFAFADETEDVGSDGSAIEEAVSDPEPDLDTESEIITEQVLSEEAEPESEQNIAQVENTEEHVVIEEHIETEQLSDEMVVTEVVEEVDVATSSTVDVPTPITLVDNIVVATTSDVDSGDIDDVTNVQIASSTVGAAEEVTASSTADDRPDTDGTVNNESDDGADTASPSLSAASTSSTSIPSSDIATTTGERATSTIPGVGDETSAVGSSTPSEVERSDFDESNMPESQTDSVPADVATVATSSSAFDLATTTSTTSVQFEPQTVIYTSAVTDANAYQFSVDQCVSVADGSYYCHTGNAVATNLDDNIYAAQDSDGDLEIFARIKDSTTQVTHNFVDDAAPAYDAASETITWHRLVSGNYQIIQYSLVTQEEVQLTFETTNSMEPDADDHYVVWQFWDGTDWEIVLYDGSDAMQITTNDVPDISPSVHDGYVLWTTAAHDGGHAAKVYDIETGHTETIEDADGGSIANPRFVLVYDTKYDNGDVVTKGFDVETGVSAPLAALPRELPTELPDPEPTEEVRALLQTKSSKEEAEVQTSPEPVPTVGGDGSSTTQTTSADGEDTRIANNTEVVAVTSAAEATTTPLELTEYDLIVESRATSTQSHNSTTTENLVE